MKKTAVQSIVFTILVALCGFVVSVASVFALTNTSLLTKVSVTNQIHYASALSISTSTVGGAYSYFYDNTSQNTITATYFTIKPLSNNCLKISALKSDLADSVFVKLTNYYSSSLNLKVVGITAYGRAVDSATINAISAVSAGYNATSSAITIAIPSSALATDIIEITLQIYES